MVKKLMVASALTVSTTALVLMAPASSRFAMAADGAYPVAEDSVFMDEGDGEFAAPVSADVQQPTKKTASKKKTDKKVASSKKADKRAPASADDEAHPAAPGNLDDLDVNAMTEAAKAQNDQAAAPAPAPTEAAPAPAPQEASAPQDAPAPVADAATPAAEPAAPVADAAPAKPKVKNHGGVKHAKVVKADGEESSEKVAPVAAHGMFANTKQACPMLREPASESAKMITVKADRKIWVEEVDGSWVRAFNKAGEPGYVSKDCFQ